MPRIRTKELTTLKIARRYHHTVKSRLVIVHYATEHGIKGAARRFDLDRKTVRAWRRRWQAAGLAGLVPRCPPIRTRRIADSTVALIEEARRDLHFGAVRTHIWLERVHRIRVAAATIRRICHRLGYPPLSRKPQRRLRQLTLFSRKRPGDCVQVDVKEVLEVRRNNLTQSLWSGELPFMETNATGQSDRVSQPPLSCLEPMPRYARALPHLKPLNRLSPKCKEPAPLQGLALHES